MSEYAKFLCKQCDKDTCRHPKGIYIVMQLPNGRYITACEYCGTILMSNDKYPVDMVMYKEYRVNKHLIDDLMYPERAIEREKKSRRDIAKVIADYADTLDW